ASISGRRLYFFPSELCVVKLFVLNKQEGFLMNANVNLAAPVGALALLGTGFLLFLAALVLIQSLIARKRARARVVLAAMLLIAGAYAAAILVFSFASHEKILARGEEKHFCELNCHLSYSIANVNEVMTLSDAPNHHPA